MQGYIKNKKLLGALSVFFSVMMSGQEASSHRAFTSDVMLTSKQESSVDTLMRAWAYVQDINTYSAQYSRYEYELCVYTALGMLLCVQSHLRDLYRHNPDCQTGYIAQLIWHLEQEYRRLRVSILQSRIIQDCFITLHTLSQTNNP